MPTEKEVVFRLSVDSGQGARSVDTLADSAKRAGKAFEDAEKQAARMNSAVGGGRPGAGGVAGGGLGPLAAAFTIAAVAQSAGAALRSLGESITQMSVRAVGAGDVIGKALRSALEALPIVGGFIRGGFETADALSGISGARAFGQRTIGVSGAFARGGATFAGAQIGAFGELAGLNRAAGNAAIDAGAARQFAAGLTPEALAGFRPRPLFGAATEQTGELRFAAALAGSEAGAAARQAAAERARFGAFGRSLGIGDIQANIAFGGRAVDQALGRSAAAGAELGGQLIAPRSVHQTAIDAEVAIQTQLTRLLGDQGRAVAALNALKQQRQALDQAELNAAQKLAGAAQAQLALDRDRLALATQRLEGGRAGAAFAGAARPGELEALLAAQRQAKQFGVQSLTDEQRGLFQAFGPLGQTFLQQQFEARGRQNPLFGQALQGFGVQGGLGALEQGQAALQDAIRQATAAANAANKDLIANALGDSQRDLGKIIADVIQAQAGQIKATILQELLSRGLLTNLNPQIIAAQPRQ